MAEYYFSARVDSETTLCVAPISDKRVELSGQEIEDRSGYFLYKVKGGSEVHEVEIIARVVSEEAAIHLSELLSMQ